jgi:hypothetical protein
VRFTVDSRDGIVHVEAKRPACSAGPIPEIGRWNEIPMVRLNVSAMAMDMLMTRPGSVRDRA